MNDTPVACQIREPTDPQGDRCPRRGRMRCRRAAAQNAPVPARSQRRGYFTPRRELLLSAVTKVAKSTGRNCVSALPQRAMADSDFPRILAGITFHHRCQSKGLRVRSPARRLTRPLASATAEIFRSCRHPPKPSPRVAHPSSLPLEGFAVLNDTPVACQIREPTDPQGDRCPRRGRMRCRRAAAQAHYLSPTGIISRPGASNFCLR